MASYALIAGAAIFLLTYALISVPRIGRTRLDRPAVAMLGAALMLLFGVIGPTEALASIDLELIVLLIGMMLLVSGLDACGFFDLVSARIAKRAKGQASFLVWLMVSTAFLSALVLNDTIAFLVTPIVVRSTKALRVSPIPYLVALAISVNVGSVMTEIGNPQNAYIAIRSGIPFLEYTVIMLPVALACLAVSIALVWAAFRKQLATPLTNAQVPPESRLERKGLAVTLMIVAAAVVAFFLTTPTWLPVIALAGGALVLFLLPFFVPATPWKLVARVDWSIILFFVGLFIVLGGVRSSGVSAAIQGGFTSLFGGNTGGLVWLTGLSSLLSNLISNVPAVLLLSEVVQGAGGSKLLWLALASSSTLAGNATILGAAANVIVVQVASRDGIEISMKEFVKAGLPVTAATLVVSTILLTVLAHA